MNRTQVVTTLAVLLCASGLLVVLADPPPPPPNPVHITGVPPAASVGDVVSGVASSDDPDEGLVVVGFSIDGESLGIDDHYPSPENDAVNPFSIRITADMAGKILEIMAIDANGNVLIIHVQIRP